MKVLLALAALVLLAASSVAASQCGACGTCGEFLYNISFPALSGNSGMNPQPNLPYDFRTLTNIASPDACCAACTAYAPWPTSDTAKTDPSLTCNAWTWQPGNTCNLVIGFPQTYQNNAYNEGMEYIGTVRQDGSGTCAQVGMMTPAFTLDFAGFDLGSAYAASPAECCQICINQRQGCTTFSYTFHSGASAAAPASGGTMICWPKSYAQVVAGAISGYNANIAGPAPCPGTTYASPSMNTASASTSGTYLSLSFDCPGNTGCPGVNDPGYTNN